MKPETAEILADAQENIRAAEMLIKGRFFEYGKNVSCLFIN
jgi:hypothetical protein